MRQYNVTEVANLLRVNEETVRRWIRFKGLKTTIACNKLGNVINEQDLISFIKTTKPKYLKMLGIEETHRNNSQFETLMDSLHELIDERDRLTDRVNEINNQLNEIRSLLKEL